MPISSVQSFVGIAKEATRGVVVAPADFLPVKTLQLTDTQSYLDDAGIRGSQVGSYGKVLGSTEAAYDLGGDVFADTIGYPLAGVLGDVATSGSGPYTHTMAIKNSGDGQPISYSITDFDGIQARAIAAAQFSECSFTFTANGLLEYSAKASGNISAAAATPARSYSTLIPYANWQAAVQIGGAASTRMLDGTVDIKRTISPIHTIDGSANPYRFWAGALSVTGKMSFVTESGEAELANYLSNTQPSLDINFGQGASAPVVAAPTTATTGGTLAAATYYYKVTATTPGGESAVSNEVSIATTGATSTVTLSWAAVTGATGYKVYRSTATNAETLLVALGAVTTYTDTGAVTPGTVTPTTNPLPAYTQVRLHMSRCAYITGAISRGKDWTQTDVTFEAIANTTDVGASAGYGPLIATLINAKAAGTYA